MIIEQEKPVRALLLAGGLGTRLRPITNEMPKCLVEVNNKSLLERWFDKLKEINCERVLVNTHYMHEKVIKFIKERQKDELEIDYIYEPVLLGTAGTLIKNKTFFKRGTNMVIHADNIMKDDLIGLLKAHNQKPKECKMTMLTFSTNEPESCGIVEIDEKGIVRTFTEKSKRPPGKIANGAIYAIDFSLIEELGKEQINDLSTEVLPRLIGQIYTWHTEGRS